MPNTPKISIIMPVYNVEKYIRRCLDSIISQTFTDWECICIDDGTPDSSGKICDEYAQKDSRFVVIHKENGGVSSARNAGLDVAKGEWICFCDSDDWVEKDYISSWYDFVKDSSYDIVVANVIDEYSDKSVPVVEKLEEIPHLNIPKFFTQEYRGGLWVTFVKNNLLKQNNIKFGKEIFFGEDFLFKIECLSVAKKVFYVNKFTYHYNKFNENSACQKISSKKCLSMLNAVRKSVETVKNHGLYENYKDSIDYRIVWTKLFYLKSLPLFNRKINSIFSDEEKNILRKNIGGGRFSKANQLLIRLLVKNHYITANVLISINNLFRRPYSK